jgi:hypothetical protein
MRSHRLTVRTPGFHPGNPGSIPGEITIEKPSSSDGGFSMVDLPWQIRTRSVREANETKESAKHFHFVNERK